LSIEWEYVSRELMKVGLLYDRAEKIVAENIKRNSNINKKTMHLFQKMLRLWLVEAKQTYNIV